MPRLSETGAREEPADVVFADMGDEAAHQGAEGDEGRTGETEPEWGEQGAEMRAKIAAREHWRDRPRCRISNTAYR